MTEYKPIVKYNVFDNKVGFPAKISSSLIADFAAAINIWWKKGAPDALMFDFSAVKRSYSSGMLAIIATIHNLKSKGYIIKVVLPDDKDSRRIFRSTNWAWLLDPQFPKSESKHDRHLVTTQFTDYKDLPAITNDFMDVVLRNMSIPSDIISALEWSIYEICDNVINHSESKIGGFVEVVTFPKQDLISFTVADAGRGILESLREAIPTLRTDAQAIGEAIKAGVTRNKQFGQGNGLAGSLRITTMTGGSIDIVSGSGRFYATMEKSNKTEGRDYQSFNGTSVIGFSARIRNKNMELLVKQLLDKAIMQRLTQEN